MFVARIHFLEPCGARVKTFDCCDGWRDEYMGYTMTWMDYEAVKHRFGHSLYRHSALGQLTCVESYRRT